MTGWRLSHGDLGHTAGGKKAHCSRLVRRVVSAACKAERGMRNGGVREKITPGRAWSSEGAERRRSCAGPASGVKGYVWVSIIGAEEREGRKAHDWFLGWAQAVARMVSLFRGGALGTSPVRGQVSKVESTSETSMTHLCCVERIPFSYFTPRL